MDTQKHSRTKSTVPVTTASDVKAIIASLDRAANRSKTVNAEISGLLSSLAGRLETQTMSLAFMGRFSSGKSSLINCALGHPLLPADDLPETGIPCHLYKGYEDDAVVVTKRDGVRHIAPCTTEAIAAFVSLRTQAGAVNTVVDDVERVDISLRRFAHEDMIWIDAPGVSSGNESRLSEVVSYDADLVVWVLGSEQFLSKSEAQGIADQVARCGPDSVAIVLNVRLQEHGASSAHAWQDAVTRLPKWRKRMIDMWAEVGLDPIWSPPLILVSAKEALRDPKGFGGPELQNLLASVRAPTCASSIALRVGRAYHEVGLAKTAALEMLVAAQETNAGRLAAVAEYEQAAALERKRVERQVKDALADFSKGFAVRAKTVGEKFCVEVRSHTIKRSDDLSAMLKKRLEEAAQAERKALKPLLEGIEGTTGPFNIDRALLVADLTVKYANNPVDSAVGSAGAGAAAGAVLGSLIFPGVGTLIGGALGGMFGNSHGQDRALTAAVALDVNQTCEAVSAQANRAVSKMKKAADDMLETVMQTYRAKTSPPAGPDEEREADLIALLGDLTDLVSSLATVRKRRRTAEETASQ